MKDTNAFDVKIDHQFNSRNNLSFRYSFEEPKIFDPSLYPPHGGPKIGGGFAGAGTNRTQEPLAKVIVHKPNRQNI